MSNFSYLTNKGKEYIGNQRNIIVIKPTIVVLPNKPINGTKIVLYNETNKIIAIESHNKTDLIYSQFFAPAGKTQIEIDPNRKVELVYITHDFNKIGKWYFALN